MKLFRAAYQVAVLALAAGLMTTLGPVRSAQAGSGVLAGPARAADNTRPCSFAAVSACQSTNPSVKTYLAFQGDTSGCTFNITVNWGDNSKNTQVVLTSPPDGTDFLAGHAYRYSDKVTTFTITVSGTVVAGGCGLNGGTLSFTLLTCSNSELSGPAWAKKFPDSDSVSTLSGSFRTDVTKFIAAMKNAGITERTISTLRPEERTYLMHYSWLVAKRKLSPLNVPYFAGDKHHPAVGICWVHVNSHGADLAASAAAAAKLIAAFGLAKVTSAPPLTSLHTAGLAIVMSTTWQSAKIKIVNASGTTVTISSKPHDGSNKTLISVGASYGVIHFRKAAQAVNDWSVNGN
jgi:hypothetical protein